MARIGPFHDTLREARDWLDSYDTAVSDGPFRLVGKSQDRRDRFVRRRLDQEPETIYRIRRTGNSNWRVDDDFTLAQANSDKILELRTQRALVRWKLDGTANPTLLPNLPEDLTGGLQGLLGRLNDEIDLLQGD